MRALLSKRRLLTKLAFMYSIAALVGWLLGALWFCLFLLSVLHLGFHYKHMFMLDRWLWQDRKMTPPAGDGSWQQIFDGIYFSQRKERKKRKELRSVIRRFRDGAEALPEAVIVLTREWAILWANKMAQRLVGLRWPADEAQRVDNLIRNPEFHNYLKQGQFGKSLELVSPTNEQLTLEFIMIPHGKSQFLLIVRDVTNLKQLEQVRKDFVANLSHELRTPLTVLQGYLEMMEGDFQPERQIWLKAHSVLLDQTKRMDALVQQLLLLSRIEAAGNGKLDEVVRVPEILAKLQDEVKALNLSKGHQICFNIASNLLVRGNSEELRSAFSNLVVNAIKYTPPAGRIEVCWRLKESRPYFEVRDNGPGISAAHVKRLTERFYRVDQARSRNNGGSGLGLAIVKHVLAHHQTALKIESQQGVGSSFSFELPEKLKVELLPVNRNY